MVRDKLKSITSITQPSKSNKQQLERPLWLISRISEEFPSFKVLPLLLLRVSRVLPYCRYQQRLNRDLA